MYEKENRKKMNSMNMKPLWKSLKKNKGLYLLQTVFCLVFNRIQ